MTAGAHGFAQMHDVDRAGGYVGIEIQHALAGPVVKQGTEGELHRIISMDDSRHRGCGSGPRKPC
ncbi:hypothetical protein SDC9_184089 [bioreactor metagenome]|uniref:Uncharacterized protein n=1 Tax=bioreactor metagenome TaxID=1076179 RepID=A0A645HCY0_9ZZZZ